jgi:hypothetical protein
VGRRAGEDLESGELDFLIAPEGYVSSTQPTEVLFEDTYTCVVWAGNETVGKTMTLEQYLELGHVVVNVAATNRHRTTTSSFCGGPITASRRGVGADLQPGAAAGRRHRSRHDHHHPAGGQVRRDPSAPSAAAADRDAADGRNAAVAQGARVRPAHHWFRGLLRTVVQQLPSSRP